MNNIKNLNLNEILSNKTLKSSMEKYAFIMKEFKENNVETNKIFQKKFNGFYRVRRNENWQKVYYEIMEKGKTSNPSFEEIVRELYNKTGRVEASFSSKLIHTLNNDMPIWDKFILQNLNKQAPAYYKENKLEISIKLYDEIIAWYDNALQTEEIQETLSLFDNNFPEYTWFSHTKKLDFLLWLKR